MKLKLYSCFDKWKYFDDIYIISDTHFSDEESYRLRGLLPTISKEDYYAQFTNENDECLSYESFVKRLVEKLDEMQIKNINKVCNKKSCLIILGDLGNVDCVKKLKAGYKILILGNHDKGASKYKRKIEYIIDEEHGSLKYDLMNKLVKVDNHLFNEVYEGPLMINDRLLLSHEDITPISQYIMNLHGHKHDLHHIVDNNHRNFCAEAINYTPLSLKHLIKDGLLKDIESIHRTSINKNKESKKGKVI